jgi:hypothetical protein
MPGPGRWATVAFSVALLWIFGFAAEARADGLTENVAATAAVADTDTTTEDVASTDGTETANAIPPAEPDPTPPPDPVATDPPPEPAPIPPVIEPIPTTDPVATDPPAEPAPTPEPIPPVIEPIPTTETPPDILPPPVSAEPAGSGHKSSIVVLDDEPLASAPISPSQGETLDALKGISPAVTDRRSPVPGNPGHGHPAPVAPDPPQLPAPNNPSAPANPAPGGVGGAGSSALGILAALFALAFAGLLGEVLPVRVAALRPPDLAFHLKRPG